MKLRLVRLLLLLAWSAAAAFALRAASVGDGRELALRARAILSQRCFQCHGLNGAARKNVFVLDRARLLSSRVLAPGDENSLLLNMIERDAMPPAGEKLSAEEKSAIRRWILAGALAWDDPSPLRRAFISEPTILSAISNDLSRAGERSRPFLRYFSLAHLYNSGASDEDMDAYRAALSKLVNSLSWHREITPPAAIDASKTVYRIDLRDYQWTASMWNRILAFYPYGIRTPEGEVIRILSGAVLPYVRADWFAHNASAPPLYHDLLALPRTVQELERMLGVDAARNLAEEKNAARAGIRTSGVSENNRALERHPTAYGAYWKSFDFRSSLDDQNIFRDPLRLNPAGGEMIFNLPNGLQAYFIADRSGNRIDKAPIEIVADRNNADDPVITNGRSCMSCHFEGVKSFRDEVREVVRGLRAGSFDRDRALALYADQSALDRLIEKDRERFLRSVSLTGAQAASAQTEPVTALSRRYRAELSIHQAASEVGLDANEFQSRARRSPRLVASGFGQLLVENGGIKRDVWERSFGEVARELELGVFAPGSQAVSRGALMTRAVDVDRSRSLIASANPTEIMRAAKTIFIASKTVFLKPDQLENELRKRPEFAAMELVIVKDARAANLRVDLDRPLFTFTFTFSVSNPETSLVVANGKVNAFDGNFAAPKIAKEILKRLQEARSAG
jgi:mono/diheme cytochrome c family protein